MNDHILSAIHAFTRKHVLVIGEADADIDLRGASERIAREAPVPIVQIEDTVMAPGRAANAAVNTAQLGAKTTFLSVVGDDPDGQSLKNTLASQGVTTRHVLSETGRATQKVQRVLAGGQVLIRFDSGTTKKVSKQSEAQLISALRALYPVVDAVLVSDYGYGILTPAVRREIAELQRRHSKPLVADSKYLDRYKAIAPTMVKPNYQEALTLLGITKREPPGKRAAQLERYRDKLLGITGAQYAAVTLDIGGAVLLQKDEPPYRTYCQPVEDSKAVGAGDTYAAAFTLALAAGTSARTAAEIAQAAATVTVHKSGTAACHQEELLEHCYSTQPKYIANRRKLQARIMHLKSQGRQIIFTNGCFDLLHSGHVSYLNLAKAQGGCLVVALNSDKSVRRLKGDGRPINPLDERIRVISGLEAVDIVTSFTEDTPHALIELIEPDLYVKGDDYTVETLPEVPLIRKLGGRTALLPLVPERSTTNTINRIRDAANIGDTHASAENLGTLH